MAGSQWHVSGLERVQLVYKAGMCDKTVCRPWEERAECCCLVRSVWRGTFFGSDSWGVCPPWPNILLASHTWRVCANGNSLLLWCAVLNDTVLYTIHNTCATSVEKDVPLFHTSCTLCVRIQPVENRISSQIASWQCETCVIQYLISCMCIWVHTRVLIIVPLILKMPFHLQNPLSFRNRAGSVLAPCLIKCQFFPFLTIDLHTFSSNREAANDCLWHSGKISTQYNEWMNSSDGMISSAGGSPIQLRVYIYIIYIRIYPSQHNFITTQWGNAEC